MNLLHAQAYGLLFVLAAGCGGGVDDGTGPLAGSSVSPGSSTPPPTNTRFELRVDGKRVELGTPYAFRTQPDANSAKSFVTLGANEDPKGGDYIRGASVLLDEPIRAGSFDCTPDAKGVTYGPAAFSANGFFGFTPTITDCVLEVEYSTSDRVVGKFSANAHPPPNSSLALEGKVSRAEGEFDVPVTSRVTR